MDEDVTICMVVYKHYDDMGWCLHNVVAYPYNWEGYNNMVDDAKDYTRLGFKVDSNWRLLNHEEARENIELEQSSLVEENEDEAH